MNVLPPQSFDRDEWLALLLAKLTDQAREGQQADVESVVAAHPDLPLRHADLTGPRGSLRHVHPAGRFAATGE